MMYFVFSPGKTFPNDGRQSDILKSPLLNLNQIDANKTSTQMHDSSHTNYLPIMHLALCMHQNAPALWMHTTPIAIQPWHPNPTLC
jgi:hypothetical protein